MTSSNRHDTRGDIERSAPGDIPVAMQTGRRAGTMPWLIGLIVLLAVGALFAFSGSNREPPTASTNPQPAPFSQPNTTGTGTQSPAPAR